MVAFTVSVNDKRICTVGIGNNGVLDVHTQWVGELRLVAGGLNCDTNEHIRWQMPELEMGDKVLIEVVETDAIDPPFARSPAEPRPANR